MGRRILFLFLLLISFHIAFPLSMKVFGVKHTSAGFEGICANLSVSVKEGDGHVFIDATPLTEIDTQTSARLAKEVACDMVGIDCRHKDFYYVIEGNFPMIGGPSAGAAMAVLTFAELKGIHLNPRISITGTINPDGSIGNIGGLKEKTLEAEKSGITLFIVPKGQKMELENMSFNSSFKVVEASTIREAMKYFAGISFGQFNDSISMDEFEKVMKPMAEDLINYSSSLLNAAVLRSNSANISSNASSVVDAILNKTLDSKSMMNKLFEQGNYYSSASYAVGVGINALYAEYLIGYYNSSNATAFVDKVVESNFRKINDSYSLINATFHIDNINDIESLNIAIDRYFEAKDLIEKAEGEKENDSFYQCLYDAAFSIVRLKTSRTWLGLIDYFNGSMDMAFNQSGLQGLALRRIENSRNMMTYAYSLYDSYFTDEAMKSLDKAQQAYDSGNFVYALFQSLESLSYSNLALQLNGMNEEQLKCRVNLSMEQARVNINMVQSKGLVPVLALSYYEYSQAFNNSVQSLLFLEYSKQFSLLSYQMANELAPFSATQAHEEKDIGIFVAAGFASILLFLCLISRRIEV